VVRETPTILSSREITPFFRAGKCNDRPHTPPTANSFSEVPQKTLPGPPTSSRQAWKTRARAHGPYVSTTTKLQLFPQKNCFPAPRFVFLFHFGRNPPQQRPHCGGNLRRCHAHFAAKKLLQPRPRYTEPVIQDVWSKESVPRSARPERASRTESASLVVALAVPLC